nr:DUF262 domain-containing protein [Exiguobacterium sp. s151]
MLKKNDSGKLVLPDFQRDFEWDKEGQKNLLSSFLAQLPIGSLLILEGEREHFAAKRLCYINPLKQSERKEECWYLLDGQQRVTSLKTFFTDLYSQNENWRETHKSLYNDLNMRWFMKVTPQNDEDIFGWNKLRFEGFREYEPSIIVDYIQNKKILRSKDFYWYHPDYKSLDSEGNIREGAKKKNDIANKAAENRLIPLYSLYNSEGQSLHEQVLEKLKNIRIEELKAEVEEEDYSLFDILGWIEPDIENQSEDKSFVDNAWMRLGAKWVQDVMNQFAKNLEQEISIIELKSNEISRAISIFENINMGGTKLNTFDLIVAKAARSSNEFEGSLSQKITHQLNEKINIPPVLCKRVSGDKPNEFLSENMNVFSDNKISKSFKDMYLNLLSIENYFKYGELKDLKVDYIKRKKILEISHEKIHESTDRIVLAIQRSLAFLNTRLGVTDINKISYELMILPISYMFLDSDNWENESVLDKIEYWYWVSIFGGAYREAQNSRCIKDVFLLHQWCTENIDNPFHYLHEKVLKEDGYTDLETLLMKNEAHNVRESVSNTILQYALSKQPKDLLAHDNTTIALNPWDVSKKTVIELPSEKFELEVHEHHVVPIASVSTIEESAKKIRSQKGNLLNSPLNKTLISSKTNLKIKDKSIKRYYQSLNDESKVCHFIPLEEELNQLENVEAFLESRFKLIRTNLISYLNTLQP